MSGEVCWMFAVCCGEFEPPKDPETEQRCKVAPGNEGIERPVPLPRPKPEPTTPKLADLAEKGTFANLKFLKLSDEQVGDVAQELADDATIETLQLDGNFLDMFSPGACRALSLALSSNRTLLNLSLNQCIIGPEGAALIADGLATNTALRELRLDCVLACLPFLCQPQPLSLSHTSPSRPPLLHCADSRIGDPGVTALSSALEKNCELRVLSLKFNLISSASVPCLATALSSNLRSQLCTLDLDGNPEISDVAKEAVILALRSRTAAVLADPAGMPSAAIPTSTIPVVEVVVAGAPVDPATHGAVPPLVVGSVELSPEGADESYSRVVGVF